MKTLTWADFAKHEPCYNPAEKYGEWQGTILDLMQHPDIPAEDKVWAFTREGIVDDKTLRLFAVGCARRVQHFMNDQRSIDALDVAERYANGNATKDELNAAMDAAMDAAMAAARAASRYASRCAARYAARYAAMAAAWDAAWNASRYAAWAAAMAAEHQAQIEIAVELLTKLK